MRKILPLTVAVALVSGCSATFDMSVMPRDSGKLYSGWLYGKGDGTGKAEIAIEGKVFSGPAVRSSSGDTGTFALINSYGPGGPRSSTAVAVSDTGAGVTVKAILRSEDGHGLRCDFQSLPTGGSGVCMDDNKQVFDVILTRR